MASANVRLVEVGATNRTRIADYARGITPDTGLLMKVHPSNFRVVGFTEEVDPADLARLGREHGIATAWDLGSGLIEHPSMRPLDMIGDETVVRDAVASGVDVVSFSGDKLLGGPQAGLVVGTRAGVRAMRSNALYRAMRCDKVTLAGLEATLELILAGRGDELPARAMLAVTRAELEPVARELAAALTRQGYACEVAESRSQPGSGSAPDVFLDTLALRVRHPGRSAGELASALRSCDPPVFARVQDGVLWVDPRTLLPGDREALLAAFARLA
jgi:L-seryl-tRNA(Ser) seleniumtransferase